MLLDLFALILFLIMTSVFAEIALGYRKIRSLAIYDGCRVASGPLVSVIVPACNEVETIGQGLASLCGQDYENLEIIVVNDRSVDSTEEVISEISMHNPMVKGVNIDFLPGGWLGKPHAMHKGVECASGQFLLFTDADVQMESTTIARAVQAMAESRLDHLCLTFRNTTKGRLLNALICDAGAGLLYLFKPWRARRGRSRFFMGVGAFNMVRSSVYRAVGGHESIKMQVIDDVFLGRLIKWGGFRQECMLADDFVRVPWYPSVSAMISGLMKNVYALFGYRLWLAMGTVVAIITATLIPIAGALLASGPAQLLFAGTVLVRIFSMGMGMAAMAIPAWSCVYLLITPIISSWIICRAVWFAHKNNGITWRGTTYPIDELRGVPWLLDGFFRRHKKQQEHYRK